MTSAGRRKGEAKSTNQSRSSQSTLFLSFTQI
jgi:hypothetical protein